MTDRPIERRGENNTGTTRERNQQQEKKRKKKKESGRRGAGEEPDRKVQINIHISMYIIQENSIASRTLT